MADKILLVQGDTLPTPVVTIYDEISGAAVDLTGASVRMLFREVGSTTLKATLTGVLIGNPPGATGQVVFSFGSTLDAPGSYEGEFEVTFPGGGIQTTYAVQKFKVREQF
jgi:hypothetical protein